MRRCAQSSLEYLMMVAFALIVTSVIILYLISVKGYARQAGKTVSTEESKITSKLSSMVSSG